MNKISNISLTPNSITYISYIYPVKKEDKYISSPAENTVISDYLYASAISNIPLVQKAENRNAESFNYKNNLRTMIQNNESVMLAIAPRTFTAKDTNGDEKISLRLGEKPGTLLSAISRLDELKNDGINTIHILPIHPPGLKNAMGTAGSLYSPARFLEKDGSLAIDPIIIDKNDSRTPSEQFKAFIDECHKRDIKVMLDLPSCASVSWFEAEKELMAFGRNGEDKTPQGWADIRMFEPWDDETKRTLNPKLLEMHKQYVDACIDLGIDGIRADVARAKPTEFWDIIIPYSRSKDPEFAWLGEAYTYECASPQVNMPYDRPEDSLRAGFDEYYGQYHIFHEWKDAKEFNDYIKLNLDMSHRLPAGKSCIGSFATHDDTSPMTHGGANFCNMTTIIQSTIPMCNPYFVDGFQSGDYYDYNYSHKDNDETVTYKMVKEQDFEAHDSEKEFQTEGYHNYQYSPKDNAQEGLVKQPHFEMEHHAFKLDIFNLSRQPGGNDPDIGRVMRETLKMRNANKDLFADKNSSFIVLDKYGDKKDQIIAYARHNNGRTAVVIANKNPNRRLTGTIKIPGLLETQELKNMTPSYGEKSRFQVAENEIRVDLSPSGAYVFEIDTPNIEEDCKENVFRQKVSE
ncbi:MAG: hypothetical protein E7Z92_05805 [Cyanobacteria bacterium SIG31]|nr:hypothetical protein [Cyanobacteria bacterium SIG31]